MTQVCEVDSNLMFSSGARKNFEQAEFLLQAGEKPNHLKFSLSGGAVSANAILDRHDAVGIFPEGLVDQTAFPGDATMHDGKIFFSYRAAFPDFSQQPGRLGMFRQQNHPAGFAIQSIDQMNAGGPVAMQSDPADETGKLVTLRRMAHEAGRLVDHEQVCIFKNNVTEFFHAAQTRHRGAGPHRRKIGGDSGAAPPAGAPAPTAVEIRIGKQGNGPVLILIVLLFILFSGLFLEGLR